MRMGLMTLEVESSQARSNRTPFLMPPGLLKKAQKAVDVTVLGCAEILLTGYKES